MKITDIIRENFSYSIEIVPPRNGNSVDYIYKNVKGMRDLITFVSVTKGAGGSLRGGTVPISTYIKSRLGVEVIIHYVCRERKIREIENDLTDLHLFNIRNILALRGDPPIGSDEAWDGDYKFAYQLCSQVREMNNGIYLPRGGEQGKRDGRKTDFAIFVAGHPEYATQKEVEFIKEKIKNGAEAIITQMIFSSKDYLKYVRELRKSGIKIPVICGIRPITTVKQAELLEKHFHIQVPNSLKKGIKKSGPSFTIAYFFDMISKLKKMDCSGVHMFILNDFYIAKEILKSSQTEQK